MALYSFFGLVLYDVWDDDWEEGNIWISVLTGSGIHTCGHTDGERKKKTGCMVRMTGAHWEAWNIEAFSWR